jgi:hypothetical protein
MWRVLNRRKPRQGSDELQGKQGSQLTSASPSTLADKSGVDSYVDQNAATAGWFLGLSSADSAERGLNSISSPGNFVIHTTAGESPGKFVLLYRHKGKLHKSSIVRSNKDGGIGVKGSSVTSPCLSELVACLSDAANAKTCKLKCPLVAHRPGANGCVLVNGGSGSSVIALPVVESREYTAIGPGSVASGAAAAVPPPANGRSSNTGSDGVRPEDVEWTVDEVCVWLGSIGLGEHCMAFRRHKIDGPALIALEPANLREMNVDAIGDRLKIMSAIELLKAKLQDEKKRPQSESTKYTHHYKLPNSAIYSTIRKGPQRVVEAAKSETVSPTVLVHGNGLVDSSPELLNRTQSLQLYERLLSGVNRMK